MNKTVESRIYLPQAEFSGKCAEIVNALSSPGAAGSSPRLVIDGKKIELSPDMADALARIARAMLTVEEGNAAADRPLPGPYRAGDAAGARRDGRAAEPETDDAGGGRHARHLAVDVGEDAGGRRDPLREDPPAPSPPPRRRARVPGASGSADGARRARRCRAVNQDRKSVV